MRGSRVVTQGERIVSPGARKTRSGQNEAPDHGGTTGGFASEGGSEWPRIENVSPVRPLGQAELKHFANLSGKAFHRFSTLRMTRHCR
jgi:hypothetical protein